MQANEFKDVKSLTQGKNSRVRRNTFRRSAIVMALAAAFAQQAAADPQAEQQESPVEHVVVTGQDASMRKSIAAEFAANNIVSAVSADDIGGLPDKNAAEALERISGVSVQRDQGEGRYVTVRGLGPQLNSVTVNGALVPSPEQSTRAVSLDVIPSGLIRAIEVQKTLTPDHDANSVGGTVDIKTLTGFDLPAGLLNLTATGSYNQNAGKTSPAAGLLWADRYLDGTLGVAVGLSLEDRKFGSDDVETGGNWNGNQTAGWSMRDYHPERQRNALGVNFDLRPQAGEAYYLHTLLSRFSDNETRDSMIISKIAGGSEAEGQVKTATVDRRLRDRKYTREINSVDLGSERSWADWKLEASGGISHANEDTPDQLNEAIFQYKNVPNIGFTNTETPTLVGPASLYNANNYTLSSIGFQQRTSRDTEKHIKADLTRKLDFGEVTSDIKFGAKTSRREKTNDTDIWSIATTGLPATMASYTNGPTEFPWGNIGLGVDPGLVRAAVAGKPKIINVAKSTISDFKMNEDIDAAYLMASTNVGRWNVLVGARNEHTDFDAVGSQIAVDGSVSPHTTSHAYSNLLPSLQARYDVDTETSVRGAWTNAVVRPDFTALSPGVTLKSSTEASMGNPDLLPLKSSNLDLGVEHLFGRDGSVSAYVFTKDIKDFNYQTDLAGTGQWVGYTTATSFANGDKAKVNGIELAYYQALKMLPAPWNGLLLGANAAFIHSSASIGRYDSASASVLSRNISLPSQSDRVANLILGYEFGRVSTRVAVNYKSPYLLAVGSDILNPALDQIVDSQTQVDFSAKYQVTKAVQVIFEAINLTNQNYYVYQSSHQYNVQNEQYGRTYNLGLKVGL